MDPVQGIGANISPYLVGGATASTLSSGVLATDLNPIAPGLSGTPSAIVEMSGLGQLLSATSTFQDRLAGLQSDLAANGADPAGVASAAQTLVNVFNTLQTSIAAIGGSGSLSGGALRGGIDLGQALDSQAQAGYANGTSSLTHLSQIGIGFQPGQDSGGLSLNQDTLQSAINTESAGTGALLARASNAFGTLAGEFVAQVGSQLTTLGALTQTAAFGSLLAGNSRGDAFLTGANDLAGALSLQSLAQPDLGGAKVGQVLLALNNYSIVSQLLA
jgi:Flagellar hook-associated protein 2 C-terminus